MTSAWPPSEPARLVAALEAFTGGIDDRELRSQLASLSAIVGNLGHEHDLGEERGRLGAALEGAMAAGDEDAVVRLLRSLTALNRSVVAPV
ncbi:MAG TPA: hypothetical protein VLD62_04405, partial [Acidimicrobiia bacterium]|nr:hypothetical protein [Acidimicrobiia bacterium]